MVYRVIQVVDTYNWRGQIARTDRSVVFTHKDVVETVRYRYKKSPTGYLVSLNEHACVRLETDRVGHGVIDFGEIYRIVEGDAAYLAILNDEAEPVEEKTWLASKDAK